MSDAGLLTIDEEAGGLERWLFIHNQDHIRLLTKALQSFPTAKFDFQILDPFPPEIDDWLLDHQRAHDDLASVTQVITNDLQTVDFTQERQRDAWLQLNNAEHVAFAVVLGI